MSKIIKFTIILLFLQQSFAANDEYIYKQLTDADGLSQSTIFATIQDRQGYLWFGTIDGLNRYDGYDFRVYVNDPADTTTISDNFISALFEDSDGLIWIGTVNGYFNCFDRKKEKFFRYFVNDYFEVINKPQAIFYEYPLAFSRNQINTVTTITEDKNGFLWIGTWGNGIIRFDKKNKSGKHILNDPENTLSLGCNRILNIFIDRSGQLWVATFGDGVDKLLTGLSELDTKNYSQPEFLHYKFDEKNPFSLSDDHVITLFEDKLNNLWIGTFSGGLNKLNSDNRNNTPEKSKFVRYIHSEKNDLSISDNTVMAIEQDNDGYLWIGTFGGGLERFDIDTGTFINFSKLSVQPGSFSDLELLSLIVDNSGILWVGSHLGEGVTKIQKKQLKFETINSISGNIKLNDNVVWSLFEDSRNNLWVGTYKGGVNVFNYKSNLKKIFFHSQDKTNTISDNHIRSIIEDKMGNIWLGTYSGGLNRIDKSWKSTSIFKNEPGNPNSLSANQVLNILVESENKMWLATFGGGLNEITFSENSSGVPVFKAYKHNPDDSTSISDDRVYTILKDKKGNFWVGTYGGGLNLFNERTGAFDVYLPNPENPNSISSDKIICLLESLKGDLWIGTSSGGLDKYIYELNSFKTYSLVHGLNSAVVYGILEDDFGNLWLSTDDGIFLFNPVSEKFTQFGIEGGVQSLEFSGGAYFKDSTGIMYFGGINGFNYFNPDSIHINTFKPSIVISKIKVMDKRIKGQTDEIILSYNQNFISFEFSALDFSAPSRNKYSYILEGFQNEWMNTDGNHRTATYTNLPAGEFTFRVKGTNSDGIWSENLAFVKIIITPPIWQTWWFVTLIIILISFFIYYLSTIRIKNQLEIEKLKLKIASDLHDNIGAGLTEISILSELAERDKTIVNSNSKKDLQKISDTARYLVDSMSDIVWVVNPQRDSLHDLIVKLKDSYNEFFSSIGISFQVNNVEKSDDIRLPMEYKQNLLLMFKEAINNAIKHSSCKKIILEAFFKNNLIEIILKDDGIGFNSGLIRYGNGITNMENRAKKLKGILSLTAESGRGTVVKFSGKLGKVSKFKAMFD
jgi:ligand-binding sensor domain-containing protein/two-component sensor histidine kinase